MDVTNHVEKLNDLIKDVKFAMLTTATADGTLHSAGTTGSQAVSMAIVAP